MLLDLVGARSQGYTDILYPIYFYTVGTVSAFRLKIVPVADCYTRVWKKRLTLNQLLLGP